MAEEVIDFDVDPEEAPDIILLDPGSKVLIPDKMTTLDALMGLIVGAFVVLLHFFLNLNSLNPAEWSSFAIATGVRPVDSLTSGLWNYGAQWIFAKYPLETAYFIFRTCGYIAAELLAVLSYYSFRELLAVSIKQYREKKAWRDAVAPGVSALGAILLSCSDPIWFACEDFGPSGLFMLVLAIACSFFIHFTRCGGKWWLYIASFFFGIAVAENPVGLVALIGCVVAYNLGLSEARASDMEMASIHDDDEFSLAMTYVFGFLGFIGPFFAALYAFKHGGGVEYTDWAGKTLPFRYFFNYFMDFFKGSASLLGWIVGIIVSIIPTALTLWYFHLIMDDDRETGIGVIIIFSISFAVSLLQFTCFDQLWAWSLAKNILVNVKELKCAFYVLNTITVVLAVAGFGMSYCCRRKYLETRVRRFVQGAFVTGVGIIALLSVASRLIPERRAMIKIVDDYVNEVAKEAEDSVWIFTDGRFDVGYELAAFNHGNRISALSLLADASPRNKYIRQRFVTSAEEKLALRDSAATALKTWKQDYPENLNKSAIQLGFDFWRRRPGEWPQMSGFLGRPSGFSKVVPEDGIAMASNVVKSVKKIMDNHYFDSCTDRNLKDDISYILWRTSRIAGVRATRADSINDSDLAVRETDFADYVSSLNPDFVVLNERLGSVGIRALRHLTPREQLRAALRQADFTAARPYATAILADHPDFLPANFAYAMFYFVEDQYSKSIEYFERCIEKNPNEPTFFNNIAIAQLYSRKLDVALKNAQRAHELAPDSVEIKDTIRRIEKEIAKEQSVMSVETVTVDK